MNFQTFRNLVVSYQVDSYLVKFSMETLNSQLRRFVLRLISNNNIIFVPKRKEKKRIFIFVLGLWKYYFLLSLFSSFNIIVIIDIWEYCNPNVSSNHIV